MEQCHQTLHVTYYLKGLYLSLYFEAFEEVIVVGVPLENNGTLVLTSHSQVLFSSDNFKLNQNLKLFFSKS